MPVKGIFKQVETIAQTGTTFEQLQGRRRTVMLAEVRTWTMAALDAAIEMENRLHLMAPAQPSEFVTDGAIAKSAAPLLRSKLEEWGLLEPSANILKVLILDGPLASKGEKRVEEPAYLVSEERTLQFLRLSARPKGALDPGVQAPTIGAITDEVDLNTVAFCGDKQVVPTVTKTWKTMLRERLSVSGANHCTEMVFANGQIQRCVIGVPSRSILMN
jgi:hypothetical protein